MSRKLMMAAVLAAVVGLAGTASAALHGRRNFPADVAGAIADPRRPAADVARDAKRKPAEMLTFAQLKPGQVVGELLPGGGYFTRLFSRGVGPKGQVYAVITEAQAKADKPPAVNAIAADPTYGNVKVLAQDFSRLQLPQKADLVWTSDNYHDLHLKKFNLDVVAVNRAIYQALKPGGLYVIVDHAAAPGSGLDVPDKLHRIDPAIVRREVEAAGFKFVGASGVLRNPADDHTKSVFDPAIRGDTDQFVLKFRR
jgi:predicted methyltransferase